MEAAAVVDETCAAFGRLGTLEPQAIHRFIVGQDRAPRTLSRDEAAAELGDPFATLLLLQAVFPRSAEAVLGAIDDATAGDDPLRQQMSFLVGEGSQLPDPEIASRGLRFLVTRGRSSDGAELIISVFDPEQTDGVELMAWDPVRGGFNYYRTVGDDGAWVFAGNSIQAVLEPTEFKGPFESHTSGAILMKELKTPWVNWDSPAATVSADIFPAGDPRATHSFFLNRERQGAITCEAAVARPSFARWARARLEAVTSDDGTVERPQRIVDQLLATRTANLISSHAESSIVASVPVDLPVTFFVDADGLALVGLPIPSEFKLDGSIYAEAIETLAVHLDDEAGFEQPGDTHFAFVVPERAAEDQAVLAQALQVGLVSDRLAAALLMVDFPNPIFSPRREALLAHVPAQAQITDGASTFSDELANAIVAAAEASPEGSPEREFAGLWEVGEGWKEAFGQTLTAYYAAIEGKLTDQAAFDDWVRLAETRRARFRQFRISEFGLLLPRSNVPAAERRMNPDATVSEEA